MSSVNGRDSNPPAALPAGADHPIFHFVFSYWRSKAPRGGGLPGRQHIDPTEMKVALPHLILIDVERGRPALRFRARLIGTAVSAATGHDLTGQYLDDAPSEALDRMRQLVETGEPYYTVQRIRNPDRQHIVFRRLVLPLARDGKTIDMLLACFISEDEAPH